MKRHILHIILLLCGITTFAHETVFFTPNRGQWDNRIRYQLEIPGGYLYLESNKQTYFFIDRPHHQHEMTSFPDKIKHHAYQAVFENANQSVQIIEELPTKFYYNYYIGNDQSKWKSSVYSYKKITYPEIYPGIDYMIYENRGDVKSDYIIRKGFSPEAISIRYDGVDAIKVKNGNLIITTSLATVTENAPYAYQVINGEKVAVSCAYVLEKNKVRFQLGKYNPEYDLIIDPVLYFSTYIGATADNFGCTATYDNAKNVYGGALVYQAGIYPTTLGAYQTAFSGASTTRDMGITKFDASGTSLMFSTYLGGSTGTEVPHSLVVDANDNLFVFGTTGSSNYPVTAGAFDPSFNAGTSVSAASQGLDYLSGTDIVITKFNPTGTGLLGSTYVGGTGNDGVNYSGTMNYNYGDFIRGEIIVDASGNPIVCSTTRSADYPTSGTAPQTVFGGGSDAVVTKLDANLTSLIWSTYFGGTAEEAGYGMQPDLSGDLFFTGGTNSVDMPVTAGAYSTTSFGGVDGFLAKLNGAGTTLLSSTYIGTAMYDQSFLIQTDLSNDVYIFGQTTGAYPQTPGKYNNGNSGQFIHKFNNSLTASIYSTRIGRNSGQIDISPTAFLVDNCYDIFICGWGGIVNTYGLADFSTTTGLPITSDGFQTTTNGSDFYLAIFTQDMVSLNYATYFGGSTSNEHVDGGTARFDKDGYVYQAVCAGCGGNDDFPTTPGAWSATNNSTNCNLGVFKFNLEEVIASTTIAAASPMCTVPFSFNFTNTSTFTDIFFWDFGDGTSDTISDPTHFYTSPGTYTVMLVAIDTTACGKNDTVYHNVFVPEPLVLSQPLDDTLCEGNSMSVDITLPGVNYSWSPATGVSDPTSGNITVTPDTTTTYTGIGINVDGCSDTVSFTVYIHNPTFAEFDLSFDTCIIPAQLTFTNSSIGTTQFLWDFGDGFTSTDPTPVHDYAAPGNYFITMITLDTTGCGFNDTAFMPLFIPTPLSITLSADTALCLGDASTLDVTGGDFFNWSPSTGLNDPTISDPLATPLVNTDYTVIATDTNGCADTASVSLTVVQPLTADFDVNYTPCLIPNTVILNNASTNSSSYIWQLDGITVTATDIIHVFNTPGNYLITLIAIDTTGCGFDDTVSSTIFLPPPAVATANGTDTICYGLTLPLTANGGESYFWFGGPGIDNVNAQNPNIIATGNYTYYVQVTDSNGCSDTASVPVYIHPVPSIDAGNDQLFDIGEGPLLNGTIPWNGEYFWTPPEGLSCTDCLNPEATPESPTTYYLHFIDEFGCETIDSVFVMVTPSVFIPNSFSPNGDGINEVFYPYVRNLQEMELMIFNRWGEIIFTSNEFDKGWDGTHKNIKCKTDVYVWKLKYISLHEPGVTREKRGHVTLLR